MMDNFTSIEAQLIYETIYQELFTICCMHNHINNADWMKLPRFKTYYQGQLNKADYYDIKERELQQLLYKLEDNYIGLSPPFQGIVNFNNIHDSYNWRNK